VVDLGGGGHIRLYGSGQPYTHTYTHTHTHARPPCSGWAESRCEGQSPLTSDVLFGVWSRMLEPWSRKCSQMAPECEFQILKGTSLPFSDPPASNIPLGAGFPISQKHNSHLVGEGVKGCVGKLSPRAAQRHALLKHPLCIASGMSGQSCPSRGKTNY
jgi:hypothetical protein